jgi:hypothetical protein
MRNDFSPSGTVCLNKRKIRYRLGLSVCFTASALAGSLLFVAATIAGKVSRGENLADAAQQLLTGIHETHYQHKTYVVESAGIYDMDCSGFVDFLLKRVAPERYADLPIEPGHARPRTAIYFDLLSGLRRHVCQDGRRSTALLMRSEATSLPGNWKQRRSDLETRDTWSSSPGLQSWQGRSNTKSRSMTPAGFIMTTTADRKKRAESEKGSSCFKWTTAVPRLPFGSTPMHICTSNQSPSDESSISPG